MKKIIKSLLSTSLLSLLLIASLGSKVQAQDVTVSFQTFYDELSPYGQWVNDPEYGDVWVPNEREDFRPYGSRGYWAMTEYGNTWVSEDPWGWACYHYGRWTYNPYYGWIWVPGYEWAPAWVSWRYGGGYCGWAPLAPGYGVGAGYYCPDNWWVFIGPEHLYRHDYYRYWRGDEYNHRYLRQTTIINNVYVDNGTHVRYNYGPRASTIEQVTHQPVQVYRVSQSYRPGAPSVQQNTLSMYRPQVNQNSVRTSRPANVITAPRSVGRPQSASFNSAPPFRQEVQRNPGGARNNANQVSPQRQNNQYQQSEPQRNIAPQQQNQGQRNNNPQPPQRVNQNENRPEPQHFNQQQNTTRPEPPRNNVQPQYNRPEPPRNNVQPQYNRPEPPRNNVQPQYNRPEPPRNVPQSQPRNNPAPQPRPQQAPAPQPRPQQAPAPQPRPQPAPQRAPGGEHREGHR